jgi:hypothetical protein
MTIKVSNKVTGITAVWILKGTSAAWIHGIQTTVKPLCIEIIYIDKFHAGQ